MNDIGYEDRKNFAKRGYNDKPERNAFRKFVKEDDKTRNLIYGYMNLEDGVRYVGFIKYGKLLTMKSILNTVQDTKLKIELKAKKWLT